MQRILKQPELSALLWERPLALWQQIEARPVLASRVLGICWFVTRLVLFAGLLIGHSFCDPQFYNYAGKLAAGQWPYTAHVPVEYPPVAMLLILLPAVPLLPFPGIAPRPDTVFVHITKIPAPDPVRYGAYGISFAVEMLILDALTLWLIQWAARRYVVGDPAGLRSGLCYVLLVFLSGAVLQKFDLASGLLCLIAVLLLISRRPALAWSTLACAMLIKGFPVLLVPVFIGYYLYTAKQHDVVAALREQRKPLLIGGLAFIATTAAWTLLVVAYAGGGGVAHSILYQGNRGTEIESLYANGTLLLGWLPGLHVFTVFNPQDLSRIVKSSIDNIMTIVSTGALVVCLLLAYAAFLRASLRRRTSAPTQMDVLQLVGMGTVAVSLVFLLTFRALPAHYLLAIAPLAVLLRFPGRKLQQYWVAALFAVAVVGQIVTKIWSDLVLLQPGAVLLLTIRNAAWIVAFSALLVALWGWEATTYRVRE